MLTFSLRKSVFISITNWMIRTPRQHSQYAPGQDQVTSKMSASWLWISQRVGLLSMSLPSQTRMETACKFFFHFHLNIFINNGVYRNPVYAYVLQIIIAANHMSGKDTHVRGLRVLGALEWVLAPISAWITLSLPFLQRPFVGRWSVCFQGTWVHHVRIAEMKKHQHFYYYYYQ